MDKECTFIGALEAALAVDGTPYDYNTLMGWSALAFRVRWYRGESGARWCPSSAVGEFADELSALRRATGYTLTAELRTDHPEPHMEQFVSRILEELSAGRPVLAYEPTKLDVGVIFGVEGDGRTVLMHDYTSGERVLRLPTGRLGPFICFLGPRGEALSAREALIEGIRLGVDQWHCGSMRALRGRYWHGRSALLTWRDDILHAGTRAPEERKLLFFVNWWVFDSLVDARCAAEKFLNRSEGLLYGSARRHHIAAAEVYEEEVALLRRTKAEQHLFLGPWTGQGIEHWTDRIREGEAAFIARFLELEARAIGELENLLMASDIPVRRAEQVSVH
ncbi:MAG TPA: hypothetical protein VGD81_17975 [Opitutaceae bacterium]